MKQNYCERVSIELQLRHLKETNYTYSDHFKRAIKFSFYFLIASFRLVVHAVYPNVFPWTVAWLKTKVNGIK